MSNAIWQMSRRQALYEDGNCPTSRVKIYVKTWRNRCYSNDIPDEIPKELMESGRAPSYRALAECILKCDLHFHGLGFSGKYTPIAEQLKNELEKNLSPQKKLI